MKSENQLKRNCTLLSEFRKCGFCRGNKMYHYDKATYIGLFKKDEEFIVYSRVLYSDTYTYNNYKDAHEHYQKLIKDVCI